MSARKIIFGTLFVAMFAYMCYSITDQYIYNIWGDSENIACTTGIEETQEISAVNPTEHQEETTVVSSTDETNIIEEIRNQLNNIQSDSNVVAIRIQEFSARMEALEQRLSLLENTSNEENSLPPTTVEGTN